MLKLIRQLAVLSALTSYSFFIGTSSVKAQNPNPVCPPSGTVPNLPANGGCKGTPSRYEIIIYEMGLCTADPLGSGTFVRTTCSATFTGPTTADLAGGASVSLGSSGSRPADGSYSHAYIVMGNTFGLSGEYELSAGPLAGTYRSNSTGTAVLNGPLTNFTETLTNFDDPGYPCTPIASENVGGGRLDAVIADSTLATASSCTGVSRIVASFAPSSSIVIDSAATGLKVTFSVTDNGMTVIDGANGVVTDFTSGPFSPTFTILN